MHNKLVTKWVGLISLTAFCQTSFADPTDFPDGIQFGSSSTFLFPDSDDLWLGNDLGSLWLYSAPTESALGATDGGVIINGSPVRVILGTGVSTSGAFEVRGYNNLYTTPPLFSVENSPATAKFRGVNVSVDSGTLSVGGSPVATTASLPTVLEGLSGKIDIGNGTASTNSVAIGLNSPVSSGNGSVALGAGTANGDYSLASGFGAQTTLRSGVALGESAKAQAQEGFATHHSTAAGYRSIAMGSGTTQAQYSVAIGLGTEIRSYSGVALGTFNNVQYGSLTSPVGTDTLLVVGNGTGWTGPERSDAILTLKNGKTTLINKTWSSSTPLADPNTSDTTDANGVALRVQGHTELQGKVTIAVPQGDIDMGIYD